MVVIGLLHMAPVVFSRPGAQTCMFASCFHSRIGCMEGALFKPHPFSITHYLAMACSPLAPDGEGKEFQVTAILQMSLGPILPKMKQIGREHSFQLLPKSF